MQPEASQVPESQEETPSESQQKTQLEYLLAKTALRIRRSLKPGRILGITVAEVRKLLKAERVIVYRFNPDWSGVVAIESVSDGLPSMLGRKIHDCCFGENWVEPYKNGRIQVTTDIYTDGLSQCHIDLLAPFQIRANLVVPIVLTGEEENDKISKQLWGLLAVQQCSDRRQWQSWEIEFLQQLTTQVAIALQRAELYEQLRTELIERQQVEIKMRRLNRELEEQLLDRTTQLVTINEALKREIRERQRIAELLFQEKELAQVTLQSIGDGVITTDMAGKIEYFNPVAEQLTGWGANEVQGVPLAEIFKIVNEVTREPVENPVERVLREDRIVGLANHTILIARDGTEYAIDDSAAPIRDRNGKTIGAVLVFHDVTQSRQLARQLSWQATHDTLTGLVNRREFERQLIEAIADAKNSDRQHALCYLDLDQFKVVNDTCGHIAGDELLRQVTALLQKRVRTTDILARLGGDEFGLLFYQCPLPMAQQIAETLRQIVQDFRFIWGGKIFTIGASIGLVAIDADAKDLNDILSAADAACYAAKGNGRNCIRVYRTDDRDLVRQRGERQWIARITQALEENRFRLHCQKIVSVTRASRRYHYEVLLRLVDETGELVSPMAFIPAAERYDLMPAVDRWVISTFFASYERYHQENPDRLQEFYAINLSGASVNNPQFFDFLAEQLTRYQIRPRTICFEITETTAIANLDRAAKLINSLKELGCRFALDDFGNGMSSLTYLKNLPIDYLKIDGSFVKNITSDRIDYVMVESFNQIAHAMGIQTIAEFVENEAILKKLQEIGVDYAQGYGIAKPRPCMFN
ncbi:histidine kinase [Hydrococcus rivularis NIES-593]|uniref:Histidine kinase n=1 Tax=Hydrococcus rivularis NIES-593 TaxID=1921803 RepID=A0A1U7HPQ6_9CYAN|nr:EAL domain-containing protein [Hydrococcus rivularis]OKH25557.1 histidine kinase [Hydrococcus rivularis NIES-593]